MALADVDPQFIPRKSLVKFEAFQSRSLALRGMAVARYQLARPLPGVTTPNAQEASFMVVLPLRRISPQYVFCAGRPRKVPEHRPSTLSIFDFRESWTSEMTQPLDTINVFVPQRALNEVTDSLRASRIEQLTTGADFIASDPTMFSLAQAMVPVLGSASKPSSLFLDHVLSAMCVHLAVRYGGIDLSCARLVGGLAPWREKRAKDLMTDRLGDDLSIAELADACGISPRHFERAFRKSTGETPHYWRMKRRIERAKVLLTEGRMGLSEIALACGFSDQSHLGRVFTRFVGCTPNEYRRIRVI
jgi:AraC family transcriptional regulator